MFHRTKGCGFITLPPSLSKKINKTYIQVRIFLKRKELRQFTAGKLRYHEIDVMLSKDVQLLNI